MSPIVDTEMENDNTNNPNIQYYYNNTMMCIYVCVLDIGLTCLLTQIVQIK